MLQNMKGLVLIYFTTLLLYVTKSERILLEQSHTKQADITLIGAYGDLANKYLWKGFYNLYLKYSHSIDNQWTIRFFGAAQKDSAQGRVLLNKTLEHSLGCADNNSLSDDDCQSFTNNIQYVRLKEEQDYAIFCKDLTFLSMQSHCYKGHSCHYQRIFYLSVPPFAYKTISRFIAAHCRPSKEAGSLKVVYEKPFGHNEQSAADQANLISQYLKDNEVFRVDHYLGKQTVQEIIPFRQDNVELNHMFHKQFVERIEIVMKETLSVKGRTFFYDKYGVVNDVMQNHLSEILYLLVMDWQANEMEQSLSQTINKNKLKLLQQIETLAEDDLVLAQYQDYQNETRSETSNPSLMTRTPTFAAVRLSVSSFAWRDVPIILVAGKKLDERSSYAKIVFKKRHFKLNNNDGCAKQEEIIFHIGHGSLHTPAILISKELPLVESYLPKGWKKTSDFDEITYSGRKGACYHIFVPVVKTGAYEILIEQIFLGRTEHFVSLTGLLESWRIWGQIVDRKNLPMKTYTGGNVAKNELDFTFDSNGVYFQTQRKLSKVETRNWMGRSLVEGDEKSVTRSLAEDIRLAALHAVTERNVFHIAFSGGTSPLKLFDYLATAMRTSLPWENCHIWQVDERCTPDESRLNFNTLSASLLDRIPYLKYRNIHPMPVITSQLCNDESAAAYEWDLKTISETPRMDYVILGMGADGHTASLFPQHEVLLEKEKLVAVAEEVPHQIKTRMTLTFPLINSARKTAVIISGRHKCEILHAIQTNECADVRAHPVCGVAPINGSLTWFINSSCNQDIS